MDEVYLRINYTYLLIITSIDNNRIISHRVVAVRVRLLKLKITRFLGKSLKPYPFGAPIVPLGVDSGNAPALSDSGLRAREMAAPALRSVFPDKNFSQSIS
jgi:hypothetical protein